IWYSSPRPGTLPEVPWGLVSSWCIPAGLEKTLAAICFLPALGLADPVEAACGGAGAHAPITSTSIRGRGLTRARHLRPCRLSAHDLRGGTSAAPTAECPRRR